MSSATDDAPFLRAEQNAGRYRDVYRATRDHLTRATVRELARPSSAERVEHLLDTAIDLVRAEPTTSFPITAVLDAAGFDAPFVYRYFDSRDHLEWAARLIEFEATVTADSTMIVERLTSCDSTSEIAEVIDVWLQEADKTEARANRMNRFASLAAVLRHPDAATPYAAMTQRLLALGSTCTRTLRSRGHLCPAIDPISMTEFMFIAPMTRVIVDLYPDLVPHQQWVPVIHRAYAVHLDTSCRTNCEPPRARVAVPADENTIDTALHEWLRVRHLHSDATRIISAAVPITRAGLDGDFRLAEVAHATGFTTSHIYRHFDSKESLRRTALVANFGATTTALLDEFDRLLAAPDAASAIDHVRAWVHALTASADAPGRRLGMQTLGYLVTGDDATSDALTRNAIEEIIDRFATTITTGQERGWFTTAVNPCALGTFFFGVLTAQAFFDPCPTAAPDAAWTQHVDHLLATMISVD